MPTKSTTYVLDATEAEANAINDWSVRQLGAPLMFEVSDDRGKSYWTTGNAPLTHEQRKLIDKQIKEVIKQAAKREKFKDYKEAKREKKLKEEKTKERRNLVDNVRDLLP